MTVLSQKAEKLRRVIGLTELHKANRIVLLLILAILEKLPESEAEEILDRFLKEFANDQG